MTQHETRSRIDKTKALTLDQRIALVTDVMADLALDHTPANGPKLANWLAANGYEPMMFYQATRIIRFGE